MRDVCLSADQEASLHLCHRFAVNVTFSKHCLFLTPSIFSSFEGALKSNAFGLLIAAKLGVTEDT